ncbi:MAG: ATP-binding cassette domain-containing protein, partial [Xanthomonadales bacterium]|nr:ATP-binding cassette domain-containing protein [Xanthomonadales bacterium]
MNDRVLRVQDLGVHFKVREGGLVRPKTLTLKAVDSVSFDLAAGETLGIVGESGCGKSTLARAMLALVKPTHGRVLWLGEDLNKLDEEALRKKRQDMQIVFQDPLAALNPRMTVRDIIAEPL